MQPRQENRLPVDAYLTYAAYNLEGEGTVTNLSRHGWRVASGQPIAVGTPLLLTVALPDMDEPLEIELATVRWSKDRAFGLETIIVGSDTRERLCEYLDERSQVHPPVSHIHSGTTQPVQPNAVALTSLAQRCEQAEGFPRVAEAPPNRRDPKRLPSLIVARLMGDLLDTEALVVDLSPTGCLVSTDQPLQHRKYISVILDAHHPDGPIKVETAAVRWVCGQKAGLEFITMTPRQKQRYRRLFLLVEAGGLGFDSGWAKTTSVSTSRITGALTSRASSGKEKIATPAPYSTICPSCRLRHGFSKL